MTDSNEAFLPEGVDYEVMLIGRLDPCFGENIYVGT